MALLSAAETRPGTQRSAAFLSPTIDFLCLGGGSLLLIPVLAWAIPDTADAHALVWAMLLSNLINHPHFVNSYQIFYRTLPAILSDRGSDSGLRARYLWAGFGAPALIGLFLAAAVLRGDATLLGYAGNAMGFFVGWHYVKQGYGMLMVDAAVRRSFFSESDKRILLINSYVCWLVAWLAANKAIAERKFWGISFAMLDVPGELLWLGGAILAATTVLAAWTLLRHARGHRDAVPVNGIVAYLAALYPWLFMLREPILGAFIPAMHSLQYLVIVWRFQLNVERGKPDAAERFLQPLGSRLAPSRAVARFAGFVGSAILLGVIGFWLAPMMLDATVPYDRGAFGDHLFFFVLLVFINIHHYFIDNAMWRKENPHTLRHLFAPR
jgi:hypothetical protein